MRSALALLTLASCRWDVDRISAGGDDGAAGGDATADASGQDGVSGDGLPMICLGPTNDQPGTPQDVSAGGTFCNQLGPATDNYTSTCSSSMTGGRDLYYRLALGAEETVYVDSVGSSAPLVVTLYEGECNLVTALVGCVQPSCGGTAFLHVWTLDPGVYCLVVDENSAQVGPGLAILNVVRAGVTALPMDFGLGAFGDTCGGVDDVSTGDCGEYLGADHHFYFTLCPPPPFYTLSLTVAACAIPGNMVASVTRAGSPCDLGCEVRPCTAAPFTFPSSASGPGIFLVSIDAQSSGACGTYTISAELSE